MSREMCVRGTVDPPRDRSGHCVCPLCRAYHSARSQNAPGRREYKRQWLQRNKDKSSAYSAKWVAANPEKRALAVKTWRARNPEKVAAMSAKAGAKWSTNNKGKRNASVKARQMAKRRAMPPWVDREQVAAFYLEAARLTQVTGVPHEVDHIVPLQAVDACGLHVPANLRVIPRSANRSKRNRREVDLCAF